MAEIFTVFITPFNSLFADFSATIWKSCQYFVSAKANKLEQQNFD